MVEIMIATTAIVVSAGGALLSQMASRGLSRTATETNLAVDEIHNAMEELLARRRAEILDLDGLSAPGEAIATYTDRVLDGETIVATYPGWVAGSPIPDVLDIRLTITWTAFDRRVRSLTLRASTSD